MKARRKDLRNYSTSAEATLWNFLKGRRLAGFKFRRQHSFGNYIIDFYCPEKKLGIELDGQVHRDSDQLLYDLKRTEFLNVNGIRIIRFENKNVFDNTSVVLDYILQHLK